VSKPEEALAAVTALADASGGLVGIEFPDGERGGAGRNLYRITYAIARPRKLLVELEEIWLLVVTEPLVANTEPGTVRLSFVQATLDWQEFGNLRPRSDVWQSGVVAFLAQQQG
jgi:hypothetical protein